MADISHRIYEPILSSLIIPSITPKIIKINYFLLIFDQITFIFDITLNINDRVAVLQDRCSQMKVVSPDSR